MSGKIISNEFNALNPADNAPGWREEHRFVAAGTIEKYTVVHWDLTNLSDSDGAYDATKTGLRVAAPGGTADLMTLVGIAQNAAVAGDEVLVVTAGVSRLIFNAVVATLTVFGHALTTGYGKAAGTGSATLRNVGYTLGASTDGSSSKANSWVFVFPGGSAV